MKGLASLTPVVLAAVAAGLLPGATGAQSASALAGIWTLNRSLSEFPPELGFNMAWAAVPDGTGQSPGAQTGGAGGRRASAGGRNPSAAAPFARPESYDDARRRQLLTAEARNPPARQIIVDTPGAVTVTNELGQSRVFHPTGKEESIEIQGVTIGVTSTRETDRFVVVYHVGQSRDIRYTYAYASTPSQLIVDVQLLERGAGDKARRIYEPGMLVEPRPASGSSATGAAPPRPLPPTPAGPGPSRPEALDQRPGAELRGLTSLGVLVEELGAQAVACGLGRDAIDSAVSRRLTDAGFTVRKNTDDDTYVYVNIITNRLPDGSCASRYDAFLYTYASATLSYRDRPVLAQVSLMHRGGLDINRPPAHAAAVVRDLSGYVDLFVAQIRDAGR